MTTYGWYHCKLCCMHVQLVDAFEDPDKVVEEVQRVSVWFSILAAITLVSSFFEVAMFMYTGEHH